MKITMKNEKIIKVLVADNSEFAKNNLRDFLESSEGIQLINVVDNGKDAYPVISLWMKHQILFLLMLFYQLWMDLLSLKK